MPASYGKLRDELTSLSKNELSLSGRQWLNVAESAGISADGAISCLELFHNWGFVLKLPSGSTDQRGGGNDTRESTEELPPVILQPQRLAEVLAQVITADKNCIKNCREGILRHSELGTVWKNYDEQLHDGFLQIIHESGLGFPILLDSSDGGDMGATLIPAMLKASEASAMEVVHEMHSQNTNLVKQGTVRVELDSLPHQLALQLQVGLRGLAVLGGWWMGGSALAVKNSDGKISSIGHFT